VNHNQLIRLLIVFYFCVWVLPSNAQTQKNAPTSVFSEKEIKELAKADHLLNKGIDLYSDLDAILNAYPVSSTENQLKTPSPLKGSNKDEMSTSVRACRVYYSGMQTKSNIYIDRLKRLKKEGKDLSKINQLVDKYKGKIKVAKKDYQKSRNSRHLEDAIMWSAMAANIHGEIQEDLYNDLTTMINEESQEAIIIADKDTTTSTTLAESESTDSIKIATEEPIEVKEAVAVAAVIPVIQEEKVEKISAPDTYFSIQIMADKKKATDAQLARVYSGKRKIIMTEGDGWFRYSLGQFKSVAEASSTMKSEQIKGFVVAYSDGKRITISQAKSILNSDQ